MIVTLELNEFSVDVRTEVAKSRNTNSEILAKMAEDTDWKVRREVAGNSNTDRKLYQN